MSAVRAQFHTMAGHTGSPVLLSHSTVVSRWLVIPMHFTSDNSKSFIDSEAWDRVVVMREWALDQISEAECSTQPGWG